MNRAASSNPKDRIGLTKVPLHYIPLSAQINQSLAHLDGALKYGEFNWRKETVAATIYLDAALRHILKFTHGEDCDADSGVHHLGHAAACLNIIMDAEHFGNLIDDRPPADGSPTTLDESREEVIRLLKLRGKDVPSTPPFHCRPPIECPSELKLVSVEDATPVELTDIALAEDYGQPIDPEDIF